MSDAVFGIGICNYTVPAALFMNGGDAKPVVVHCLHDVVEAFGYDSRSNKASVRFDKRLNKAADLNDHVGDDVCDYNIILFPRCSYRALG